jgi:HlyD family secretion protein
MDPARAMRQGSGATQGRARRGGIGGGDVRPAIVFIQTDSASRPEPRSVMLGVNDWDYTEVIRGIEQGERIVLMSVARLQQQQQEMLDRMRTNTGFPGTTQPTRGMPRR